MIENLTLDRYMIMSVITGVYDPSLPTNAIRSREVYDEWEITENDAVLIFADYFDGCLRRNVSRVTSKDELQRFSIAVMESIAVRTNLVNRFQVIVGHICQVSSKEPNYAIDITRPVLDDLPTRYNMPNLFIGDVIIKVPILLL